jgi:hypothetical protein
VPSVPPSPPPVTNPPPAGQTKLQKAKNDLWSVQKALIDAKSIAENEKQSADAALNYEDTLRAQYENLTDSEEKKQFHAKLLAAAEVVSSALKRAEAAKAEVSRLEAEEKRLTALISSLGG